MVLLFLGYIFIAMRNRKVFVAMSGGVDSSVAALLLKEKGCEVTGCHLTCWEGCDSKEDRRDALRVAAKLGIPFLTFDFRKEYRERVYNYLVREYAAGRTPNPDVKCNQYIKFGIFLEEALALGADYIATGHYIRKEGEKIYEARDKNKDQSYFLWALTPEKLRRCLFPIGDYLKSEVREVARKAGLPTAEKKDSQGLCFVGKIDFSDFIREALPRKPGIISDLRGRTLGEHDGAHFYTVGQRHGLNLGGLSEPVYVAERDLATNTLIVVPKSDSALYREEILVGGLNLLSELPPEIEVRIRYRQPKQKARIMNHESGIMRIKFETPQRGVASGQSAVFYQDEELLGGGVIED